MPGRPLDLALALPAGTSASLVRLHYRRVNQAERYQAAEMAPNADGYRFTIPAGYTNSPFPLQYYFELRLAQGAALYPGFNRELTNQPYFVVPIAAR